MSFRKLKPLTFVPKGVSDSMDGTNSFAGSMLSLANLVQSPGDTGIYVPRPASQLIYDFTQNLLAVDSALDYLAVDASGAGLAVNSANGAISAQLVVGTRIYGFAVSALYPGYDIPFCYDKLVADFIPISGINAGNLPKTLNTEGDWTPPNINAVTNGRIMFCHPGFAGGASGKFFGWLDISSFAIDTLLGNTVAGSPVISSINDGALSTPIADGVQPGMAISGAGIPAGATVVSVANGTFDLSTTGTTNGTASVSAVANLTGVAVGMAVTGPQFAAGTYVQALPGGGVVTLNQNALGTASATDINFTGGGSITLSANATASGNNVALGISGGSYAAPQWGAGNTNTNPLAAVPLWISQFSGRAYFAVNNSVVLSDEGEPCQVTNASQALILGDNTPVTALAPLPLVSLVTGGASQSLIAFKGAQTIFQITGDPATTNLAVASVTGSVGTLAPNTICSCPQGLAFMAPDGLRILALTSLESDVIGDYGRGVAAPFINTPYPSRMCAAYGQNSFRISVQNGVLAGQPWQEFVFNFSEKSWTGPHSFPASLISPYAVGAEVGFVVVPQANTASLWFSSLVPNENSNYVEDGNNLACLYKTSLLPDNREMSTNLVVTTAAAMSIPPGVSVAVVAQDEGGNVLGNVTVSPPAGANPAVWGQAKWGSFNWGAAQGYLKQWRIPWIAPIVCKQATISLAAPAAPSLAFGNLYLGYQPRGYLLEDAA